MDEAKPASPAKGDWLDRLARSAAVLGAFIAVGQTASKTVESHYQQKIEEAKANAEIKISKEKSESSLASDFLKIILDKDTSPSDRVLVLDALRGLPTHPLQKWAEERYTAGEAAMAAYERADNDRLRALSEQDQQSRTTKELTAQLTLVTIQIERYKNDQDKSEKLRNERFVISQQLAQVTKTTANPTTQSAGPASVVIQTTTTITTTTFFGIPLEKVKAGFTNQFSGEAKAKAEKNVDNYLPPLEACMRENGFVDVSTVAEIASQIAHETGSFRFLVEFGSGDIYEGRADLGNSQPGDGPRFKGRGLLGLVGRANYLRMGQQLGVGDRFAQAPEDVLIPENAARIACFYFKALGNRFREAAKNEDSVTVRRMVNGGLNGLDNVRANRSKFLALLQETDKGK